MTLSHISLYINEIITNEITPSELKSIFQVKTLVTLLSFSLFYLLLCSSFFFLLFFLLSSTYFSITIFSLVSGLYIHSQHTILNFHSTKINEDFVIYLFIYIYISQLNSTHFLFSKIHTNTISLSIFIYPSIYLSSCLYST